MRADNRIVESSGHRIIDDFRLSIVDLGNSISSLRSQFSNLISQISNPRSQISQLKFPISFLREAARAGDPLPRRNPTFCHNRGPEAPRCQATDFLSIHTDWLCRKMFGYVWFIHNDLREMPHFRHFISLFLLNPHMPRIHSRAHAEIILPLPAFGLALFHLSL